MIAARPVKWLMAALVLLLGGLLRLPMEQSYSRDLEANHLSSEKLNLSLRDELGQSFFVAVLGGFRSLVASIVEVESIDDWQHQNWAQVEAAYAICTRLQPREFHYWDFRAWMSSHNAFDYYKYEDMTRPGLQPWIRQNLVCHGIDVLKEGMKHLPDDYRLPRAVGMLMADFEKNRDANYYEASQWFHKAWELRPSYRVLYRFHVYNLARAPGHELEAWPLLLEMYHSGILDKGDHTPTGETLLVQLLPKVKPLLPDAALPPELAARAAAIIKLQQERDAKVNQRLQREADDFKALEDAVLKKQRASTAPAPAPTPGQ